MTATHELTDAMHAVETEAAAVYGHRWHLYLGRDHGRPTGNIWAVTTECHTGGCGTTLEARTPEQMRGEIARCEWAWNRYRFPVAVPAGVA